MRLIPPLLLLLALGTGVAQETPDDKAARIKRAIDWFSDPSEEIRAAGRKELLAIGPDAVPYLEKLLELRNALDIHRLLKDVDRAKGPDGRWIDESDLPTEEELQKNAPKTTKEEAERYVYNKLLEAHAAARAHKYQRGYDIAQALMTLEGTKSRYAAEIHKIRRFCDNWITQNSLVRSRVVSPSTTGIVGAKYDFILRMENAFKQGIKIIFDPGNAMRASTPVVVVEITCRVVSFNASEDILRGNLEVNVEQEIPIALGAQWEKVFTIDTGAMLPDDKENIRIYSIGAWTQPMKVDYGIGTTVKKIFFEPATFKVVPKKYEHLLDDPLARLSQAIEVGQVNEVFLAAMLVDDAHQLDAAEKLILMLEKAHSPGVKPEARAVIGNILHAMTGGRHGDDAKRWRAWYDGQRGTSAKKP